VSGYDFLNGVRVLEVAALGPSSLGGYLADMGAEVVKVEDKAGDGVRYAGNPAMGSPDGESLLHLRWNRGKTSIAIDLKSDAGKALFLDLAAKAEIVIEGMRAGILDRLGLGFEALSAVNPAIVFCSVSGLGRYGPYAEMGSHGPSFDAFGALSSINPYALTKEERVKSGAVPVGMHAMGLYAAVGTLAALTRARATGAGALVEVAAADCAAHWLPDAIDAALNPDQCFDRPGFLGGKGKQANWPRLWRYDCIDGRGIFFQALSPKFWERFCTAVARPDLAAAYHAGRDVNDADEDVHAELVKLFATRAFAEWMALFGKHDVPAGAANSRETLVSDPHFLARHNVYDIDLPGAGTLHLTTTPIKTPDQDFAPGLAPRAGEQAEAILADWLGDSAARHRASGALL
jgi:crotonobetainyl-CoA:carnitine CoA-transferase CaiB-like acyl-CoA transferase